MFRPLAVAAFFLALLAASPAAGTDPAAEAAASYRIDTAGSTRTAAPGAKGAIVLSIVPVAKVHVHPQAPLKITLESSGLKLAKSTLGHGDAVDPKAEGPRFEVPFVAEKGGPQQAKAKLDFFICSDQWCVKQVKDVVVTVDVR